MPLAKIHVVEGGYDEARIAKVSAAIPAALMSTLRRSFEFIRAQKDGRTGERRNQAIPRYADRGQHLGLI
jgi:hypothetical protein